MKAAPQLNSKIRASEYEREEMKKRALETERRDTRGKQDRYRTTSYCFVLRFSLERI